MLSEKTDPHYLTALRQMLIDRFDLDELRDLCFALGIDYALFPQWTAGMARELIVHLVRRDSISVLLEKIPILRPDINIQAYIDSYLNAEKIIKSMGNDSDPNRISLAWQQSMGNSPSSRPIIAGQTCLVPLETRDNDGSVLRALSLPNGSTLWELEFPDVAINGLTQARNETVLVSLSHFGSYDGEGMLLAVNTRGEIIWRFTPGAQLVSTAAVVDIGELDIISSDQVVENKDLVDASALVAVTLDHQWLVIIDFDTGDQLMEVALTSEASLYSPVFIHDRIVIPCMAPTILAVDVYGEVKWRYDFQTLSGIQVNQSPCAVGKLIVMSLSNGAVYCFHYADGSVAWELEEGSQAAVTAPVTDGTRVYVGSDQGIHAYLLANGRKVWFTPYSQIDILPVIWNESIVVITEECVLLALDRHTGKTIWKEQLENGLQHTPALADGDENGPYAFLLDRRGNAVALTIPASPLIHEVAARWKRAARAWEYQGQLKRAALAWIRSADYLKDNGHAISECAPAWQSAARLFSNLGDQERATNCQSEYARCLELPLISLEVEHKGLVVNHWSLLNFAVRNEGYGLARQLVVQIQAEQFEGKVAMTQALANLPPGRSRNRRIDVKPLTAGSSVPLHIEVSFLDESGSFHSQEEIIYLSVANNTSNRKPSSLPVLTPVIGQVGDSSLQRSAVEIEIRIDSGDSAYAVEVSLDDGHVFSGGKLPKAIAIWRPSGDPTEDGKELFHQLVSDPIIRDAWNTAQDAAVIQSLPRRIRLRIGLEVPELHALPWELLHDGTATLSANTTTPFSRYIPVPKPWGQPLMTRPIKVLGIISNPLDLQDRYQLARVDVDLEKYILATAFKGISQEMVRLEFMPSPVSIENLSDVLRHGYHIVHFIGHGRFVGHSRHAEIILEDGQGYGQLVADQTLARVFSHADVQPNLVFLSACQSASHSSRDTFVGVGPRLVQAGVPAVIGMQDRVSITTARKITQTFYHRLTEHGFVDQALNEARASLLLVDPSAVKIPILFMRLTSGRLWDLSL
jgi:outer membrane protein assembly factor BamB